MKKSLFIMALGAIALTSCSQDEVLEVKQDAISFAVATENASRAAITATDIAEGKDFAFDVWAYEHGTDKPYITEELVDQDGDGGGSGLYKMQHTYYWPIENLDFYAVYPVSEELTTAAGGANPKISTYIVDSDHVDDLLYSVSMNTAKGDGVADLNFRHALAMIQFNVASDDTYGLDVEVSEINIVNVAQTNSYTLPRETTAADNTSRGVWTASPAQTGTYTWTEGLTYTFDDTDVDVTEGGVYFLLPQAFTPSVPSSSAWTGTYFKIKCKLSKNGVYVHNDYVAVPAVAPDNNEWKEGNKYIYTLKFGQGGGYIPGTVNPAIIPISFDITVDEMTPVTVEEVPVVAPTV